MEMKKDIESLAIWYIPAFCITVLLSAIASGFFEHIFSTSDGFSTGKFMLWSTLVQSIDLIDNIAVAIWLYVQSVKEPKARKFLWMLFGIVAHLFAAIIYIALKIAEDVRSSNQSLQPTADGDQGVGIKGS